MSGTSNEQGNGTIALGRFLSKLTGDCYDHGDCFSFGSVDGCKDYCPAMLRGECEIYDADFVERS